MTATVLIVEDEEDIAEVLQYNLEKEGFRSEISLRGDEALEMVEKVRPDLLILDLMLPGMDGLEILRLLRRKRESEALPILVLTAKGEEIDRVVGLELGADDYVTKPFSPREVVLRVKALLRRSEPPASDAEELVVGDIRLDIPDHRLYIEEREVRLTATEFRLLRQLMERAGRVQTRERLLAEAWGYSEDVDSRTVDTHARRLRSKLGDHADRIETVIGVGYRFRA